ncbi:hypothetical protein L208DRAFT_1262765, partial [Tricholoma matsutake]
KTTTEILINLDIPLHVVQCMLKCWKEIGEVYKDRTRMGCTPLMKPDEVKFMLAVLDQNPDIYYLDEIQEQLGDQHGIEISLATIWQTLKRLGITTKQASISQHLLYFTLAIGNELPERLVCIDEATVNILTSYRENSWSHQGLQVQKSTKFVCGTQCIIFQCGNGYCLNRT